MKNMSKHTNDPPLSDDVQESLESFETEIDEVSYEELDSDGNATNSAVKIRDLREKLKKALSERDEYLAQLQRERADAINLRREEESKRQHMKSHILTQIAFDMIPALDSFDSAMRGAGWQAVDPNWRIGVEYIYQQLMKALSDNGLESFESVGQAYDPELHEIHAEVESDQPTNQIIETIQKGYKQAGIVIRPEKVIIGKSTN